MLLVGPDSSATVMQDIQPTGAASVPGNGKNASATDFSIAAIMAKGAPPVKDKTSPEADLLYWPMRSPFASDSESSGGPSPSWDRTPGQKRDRSTPASSVPEEDEEPEVDEGSDLNDETPSDDHPGKSPRPKKPSGSGSQKQRRSSSDGSASAANPYADTLKGRCNCQDLLRVDCILENKDLWEKFNELGTEMIITKTGRDYEIADRLTKEGSENETVTGTSLTYQALYSHPRCKLNLIWRILLMHQWYRWTSPGSVLEIKCDCGSQAALVRLKCSHLKCLSYDSGSKIHLTRKKHCDHPASPDHILRFVEWAQNEIAVVPDFHKRILFSDEAHFWLNGYVNKQNCRIWSEANPQVYVETSLHPEKLTVWCALWAGGIIGPYFFKNDEGHNVTVNGDWYRAMITNFSIPELNNHDVQELWFQQDGATCNTARATIDFLKDTFGDRLISRFGPVNWPPRSCDLTPLDYFLWGYVKSLVYADKPQTFDHLEDNIRRVIADIRPQMLEKVIESWTSGLDYIRASRGSHTPEIIFI
ncbi:uncharacterized protein TNCV_3554471 [Trichonephila clavipes]|nr:uncharacterized protein TNCV_3554471 [Trichonephila clavipes]